ncbi:hypothetical protein B0H17DRAFT_1215432 [Mycena rosella]|uniref:Uncharacterized protein n=1 Tax=Mycena rosella TaxID=1033263 RepID=A0AAD7CHD0_MYCRO|nr:hypothetical protein B0H17DRAFT_1215432 [Mycena rosella]
MDAAQFAACFDVGAFGLIDAIGPDVLQTCLQGRSIDGDKFLRAEIQKLHVYGPGSFVNAHQAPRLGGDTTIGSLIVVLPTTHTGGACTLEHEGTTLFSPPVLSYFALYGDVKQTMQPIHTGHRITLTYALSIADRNGSTLADQHTAPDAERALEAALQALLADPAFLPTGGFLASGLAHKYLIPLDRVCTPPQVDPQTPVACCQWDPILRLLKGVDARLRAAAERVGLGPRVQLLYNTYDGRDVLVDDIVDLFGVHEGFELDDLENANEVIMRVGIELQRGEDRAQAQVARVLRAYRSYYGSYYQDPKHALSSTGAPVHWLTHMTELNRVKSAYIDGSSMVGHQYGDAGIFMRVPAVGEGVRASVG